MNGLTIHLTENDEKLLVEALATCVCCGRLFGTVAPDVMEFATTLGNMLNNKESGEVDAKKETN